jgi:N-acetylglucosamine-6-phosphate deacetylase
MLYIAPRALAAPDRLLTGRAVLVEGGRIAAVGPAGEVPCPPAARRLEADDLILAPGFIDLQINGAFGWDFTAEPSAIWRVAALLPRYGVTSFLPTIITSPLETVSAAQELICRGAPPGFVGAVPLGLHLEGPFLSPEKRGAHDPAYLRLPDLRAARRWSPGEGVKMVTLAPELPGALDLVRALAQRGVVVGAGHSTASAEQAQAGFDAGILYGTHLFNAMPPLDHRRPGLAGALLAASRVTVGLIADGLHLHPRVVELAWRAKGPSRVSLVTDAMAGLGGPDGVYRLGGWNVTVEGSAARLEDGRLAGSVLSLDRAVRNLREFTRCELHEAVASVTAVPASLLGIAASRGRIAPGAVADLTLLTEDLQVAATIAAGEPVYER